MIKRSRLEIYLDILRVVKSGINKPTRIMYSANLSWNPLQKILQSMVAQDLIEVNQRGNRKIYEISEKGRAALKYFNQAKELVTIDVVTEPNRRVYPL